jgi:DNA-binding FadR family transcriptional regulator
MPLRTPSRTTLITQVIAQLREQITSGEWPIGQRIPPEPELAAALGIGRNTLREAVLALVHAGLLERRQGSGTYVIGSTELSTAVARRVAEAQLADVLEVRRALEVEAARLAALRRTDKDLEALDNALAAREAAWRGGSAATFIEADVALHVMVVVASHNHVLSDLYLDFGAALRASLADHVGNELTQERYVDHSRLVEAIRAGDPAAAATEAAAYLEPLAH